MNKLCKLKHKKVVMAISVVLGLIICIMLTTIVYINNYYHALPDISRWVSSTEVEVHDDQGGRNNVLSVYGSEDLVLNREAYKENLVNLPMDYREVVIEGGCHAYFGMYGPQDGDGTPSISNEEQMKQTVEAVCDLIE